MRFILSICLVFLFVTVSASIPDYNLIRCKQYTIQDGLPQSFVKNIYQDSKGYIWICTQDGISKFNGNSFKNYFFDPYSENSLVSNYVLKINSWKEGKILISSPLGFCFLNPSTDEFENFTYDRNKYGVINSILVDDNFKLFLGTNKGLFEGEISDSLTIKLLKKGRVEFLCKSKTGIKVTIDGNFYNWGVEEPLINEPVLSFLNTPKGILIGTATSIVLRTEKKDSILKTVEGVNCIKKFGEEYWVATNNGIIVFDKDLNFDQKVSKKPGNGLLSNVVLDAFQDSFGIIWLGTDEGLNKLDASKQQFLHVQRSALMENANLNDNVWSFLKKDSILYTGHINGVLKHNLNTDSVSWIEIKGHVLSLKEWGEKMLIGTSNGLYYGDLDDNAVLRKVNVPDSVKLSNIFSIEKVNGSFLIGSSYGITVLSNSLEYIDHINLNNVRNIKADRENRVWFTAYPSGVYELAFKDSSKKITYSYKELDQIKSLYSLCLHTDFENNLWIGLFGGGVVYYNTKDGKTIHYSTKNGLANNSVYGIIEDKHNHLWMSTNSGLSKFHISERKFNSYNVNDGLQSMEFNSGAFYKSANNRMYFGGVNGYNIVDPEKYVHNTIEPIVHIASIKFQNEELIDQIEEGVLELSSKQNSLTISVDGLHYSSPEENIYAYYLEGFSERWESAKNKREFYFSNLDYGDYTFNVRVANSDREWMKGSKQLKIVIRPAYYQTWLFRVSIGLFILAVFFGFYYYRVTQRKIQRKLLERKIRERTKEVEHQKSVLEQQKSLLEEEKDREEQLLLNVLPLETAKELISTGRAAPKHYRMASVMFADFKNFTKITENLTPNQLVEELDDFFANFDDIVDRYGIEKIKTSGDAYMCAGGIPIRNRTNPIDCILTALQFLKFVEEKKRNQQSTNKQVWDIRIGIHTGELIAGVVGKKKFLYDIWGDTVNTAARMETSAEPGRINISGTTFEFIKDYFDCEYRGKIPVKNKGLIDMYYVNRIIAEYSEDDQGIVPNKRFFEILNFNVFSQVNYNKVKQYVVNKLKRELPSNLYYHGVHHTVDVIDSAERIGKAEGVDPEHLMLIKLAALFHDSGFLNKYVDNEEQGALLAKELLPKYGFTDHQVELVEGMILATKIPQNPQNHLEQILCDADLDYLGRSKKEFDKISDSLEKEFLEYGIIKQREDWDPIQIKFLTVHQYYTKTCQEERSVEKQKRLEEIKQRLES